MRWDWREGQESDHLSHNMEFGYYYKYGWSTLVEWCNHEIRFVCLFVCKITRKERSHYIGHLWALVLAFCCFPLELHQSGVSTTGDIFSSLQELPVFKQHWILVSSKGQRAKAMVCPHEPSANWGWKWSRFSSESPKLLRKDISTASDMLSKLLR